MPKLSIITVNLNNKAGLIDTAKSVVTQETCLLVQRAGRRDLSGYEQRD